MDALGVRAAEVPGGLIVLGSLHAEMTAMLENRDAPLFNRTTDSLELGHLDIASIVEILRVHADDDPSRLLFLWNLFEGVPKFYRDAYEQGVLDADRKDVLRRLFFFQLLPPAHGGGQLVFARIARSLRYGSAISGQTPRMQ